MHQTKLLSSRRLRRTPFTDRVEALGVRDFTVVNHMLLPKGFGRTVSEDYWHLLTHVQLWDVGCQRQVEIAGPQAKAFVQRLTPRDLGALRYGQALYVPLTDERGGMVNDPVLLQVESNRLRLSIADSDVLLWAKGFALGTGAQVEIDEPDVYPLAVQGPKAMDLVARVFGDGVRELRYFGFDRFDFRGHPLLICRSGYSKQGGVEIYVDDWSLGGELWDVLWEAGQPFQISPGCPNLPERVEGGLLSYGNDMTRENNPFECGLGRWCTTDGSIDYIGREALANIADPGPERQVRGVWLRAEECPVCSEPWPVTVDGRWCGQVTTAAYSPRLKAIVGIAMMEKYAWEPGTSVRVTSSEGCDFEGVVTTLPFPDLPSSEMTAPRQ